MPLPISNFEVLDLGMVLYKGIVEDPKKIIDTVESLELKLNGVDLNTTSVKPWVPWQNESAGTFETFCLQKFIEQPQNIKQDDIFYEEQMYISKELFGSLDVALKHYTTELYPFAEKNIKSREHTMHLLRYDEAGYLPAHQDQGVSSRVLSVLLYLNDDYEGGEITFRHSNITMKPEPGSILFFPSNFLYVHEIAPVTKGPRYALPNWYHNIPTELKRNSTGAE